MSDNVVLSKHFDSLASAIQRCLSAGYAPTAYIPAGHASVLDTVPATVDGGMWYELEGHVPVIKFHLKNADFQVNSTPLLDEDLVVHLCAHQYSETTYEDFCGGNWTATGFTSSANDLLIISPYTTDVDTYLFWGFDFLNGKYLTRCGDLTLGGHDFTISFWHWDFDSEDELPIIRFYTAAGDEELTIFARTVSSTSTEDIIGIKYNGNTYEFNHSKPFNAGAHSEFVFHHSGSIAYFHNGELQNTVSTSISEKTYTSLIVGLKDVGTSATHEAIIGDFRIYGSLARHNTNFTPTIDAWGYTE